MKRRIVALIVAVAACSVAAFFVPAMLALRSTARRRELLELQHEGSVVASDIALAGTIDLTALRHELPAGHDVGIYDSTGRLTQGTGPAAADAVVRQGYDGSVAEGYVGHDLVVEVPVRPGPDQPVSVVRILEPAGESRRHLRAPLVALAAAAAAVIAAAALAGVLFSSWLGRPLDRLRRWATDLPSEPQPAPPTGIGELDQLGATIEEAHARIHLLLERERSFSSHVSHQLRTPVAAARVAIEAELEAPRPDPRLVLHESLDALDRLETTITGLLALTRRPDRAPDWTPVDGLLHAAAERWAAPFARSDRRIVVRPSGARARVDGETARHVLDVLLDNALTHGTGEVVVTARQVGEQVDIDVGDEGSMLAGADPFSDRPAGGGHGIGLHLARTLAESTGGQLGQLAGEPRTTFRLSLRSPAAHLALTDR